MPASAASASSEGDASSTMTGAYFRCHRTPLMEGYVTQSLDGKPVAPPDGRRARRSDTGTLRTTLFPNFWQHTNCDYAAAARLTPLGPDETHMRGTGWSTARRSRASDYTLDRLLPVWDLTNQQDWAICEDQQAGVSSRAYVPGPFSKIPRAQRRAVPRLVSRQSSRVTLPSQARIVIIGGGAIGCSHRLPPRASSARRDVWCWRRAG